MPCLYCNKVPLDVSDYLSFNDFHACRASHALRLFQEYISTRYAYSPIDMPLATMRAQLPDYLHSCLDEVECDLEFCYLILSASAYIEW